jgi:hypothetical protein
MRSERAQGIGGHESESHIVIILYLMVMMLTENRPCEQKGARCLCLRLRLYLTEWTAHQASP